MTTVKTIFVIVFFNSFIFCQQGFLSITSEPSGATIHIDGSYRGTTPIDLLTLSTGRHTVSVSFENYETESFALNIKTNEIEKKHVLLRKKDDIIVKPTETEQLDVGKGKLTIITDPAGATVYIDDTKVQGQTPFTLEGVSAGLRKIEIHKHMGEPLNDNLIIKKEIQIRKNQTELIKINLKDYLKTGAVIFNTNADFTKSSTTITVTNKTFGKSNTYKIPNVNSLLVGDYEIFYQDSKKLSFNVYPDKKTIIFIPYLENKPYYKNVEHHENYITLDEYYKGFNEKFSIEERDILSHKLEYNGWFTASIVSAVITLGVIINPSNHSEEDQEGYLLFTGGMTLGLAIIGVIVGINSYQETEVIKENKIKNELTRAELKKSYELLFKKWQDDINKENEQIKKINEEIDKRNRLIPEASVRYE